MGVAQFLVQLVCAAVLGDRCERISSEVLVDIEQRDRLHQWTQNNLLVVGEVELKRYFRYAILPALTSSDLKSHLNSSVS